MDSRDELGSLERRKKIPFLPGTESRSTTIKMCRENAHVTENGYNIRRCTGTLKYVLLTPTTLNCHAELFTTAIASGLG